MPKEKPLKAESPADAKKREAIMEGERRHLEYVATLDPRERANLAPWSV
jgi:hypothetical protein